MCREGDFLTKETYDITGMSCSACSARVEKAVAKILGEENVSVNLLTNSMQVKYDDTKFSGADRSALSAASYHKMGEITSKKCVNSLPVFEGAGGGHA